MFLAFSGGKDSLTVAHLCEPWGDRLTLLWCDTGHMAPHMSDFVQSHRERFSLIKVQPQRPLMDHWAEHGAPADLIPLEHLEGVDWRYPRLQPWSVCCGTHRTWPLVEFLKQQSAPCAFLAGQRQQDQGANVTGIRGLMPGHVEFGLPLWGWTDADVLAFVAQEGIQLQPHHATCGTSIECIICPANLSREKMNLLDRHYPAEADFVRRLASHSLGLAAAKANEIMGVINGTGTAEREGVR
ncbi:phosphoadenosine phosphosulfate reductase family protein [Methylobacterium sp. W2]|uniref:phosphoadenosine phosphosulfate reductase domain-containing protein n=1 Tax=Methylobacterium sp. W2 TaxID=2598107 RepID=UPI001D0C2816|nr:phosphoadenosine phosphosulfate reductase family protein [Methylobacterium sp. W2]